MSRIDGKVVRKSFLKKMSLSKIREMKHVFCFSFIPEKDFNELLFYLFTDKSIRGRGVGSKTKQFIFKAWGKDLLHQGRGDPTV